MTPKQSVISWDFLICRSAKGVWWLVWVACSGHGLSRLRVREGIKRRREEAKAKVDVKAPACADSCIRLNEQLVVASRMIGRHLQVSPS